LGTISALVLVMENKEKPVSRWPVEGPSEYLLLAGRQASKIKEIMPTQNNNTHKITTHIRKLQKYTRSTKNNYPKDNLKLATKHPRRIRILQHVQKVKTPKQDSTVFIFL